MIERGVLAVMLIAASSAAAGDYLARKTELQQLVEKKQHQPALKLAKQLNREMPDDLDIYGYLVETHLALGQPGEAEVAAQWMLDMREQDSRSLYWAGRVREALGMKQGALDLYLEAYRRTPRHEIERREAIAKRIEGLKPAPGME